jgi:hypothetical protein
MTVRPAASPAVHRSGNTAHPVAVRVGRTVTVTMTPAVLDCARTLRDMSLRRERDAVKPSSYGLAAWDREFIARVVSDPQFRQRGVAYGGDAAAAWAVVDPRVHRLRVWQKRPSASYSDTAIAMDAAVFTNGPMMGKRLSRRSKLTRRRVAGEFAARTAAGAAAGLAVRRRHRRLGGATAALGLAYGSMRAWTRSFTHWTPCGRVVSAEHQINELKSFDDEGPRHSWFGRFSTDFQSYAIGYGDLPSDVVEGLGGLILLVQDFAPVGAGGTGAGPGSDFAQLSAKRGIVAWGLVPLETSAEAGLEGVLIVLGSDHALDAATAAWMLAEIGARDAVGMDQRGAVMMGAGRSFLIRRPRLHRQAMQTYGLCCV